ncbi:helix-turn-helix domain-containing protein [Rhizobium sp. NZLR1b]|nr:helix-turn-helix domain-containing protein [Rhizobium sp. NZLR1b]
MTPQQAAEILTISVKLLRAHVKAGDIAFIAKGTGVKRRKMAFDPADVQEFIDRRRTRKCQSSNMPKADLPLNFHPAAIGASGVLNTPSGAV